MAADLKIQGATYPDVPFIDAAKDGGGTQRYTDVSDTTATANDVISGKIFHLSDGSQAEGSYEVMSMTVLSYGHSTWNDFINAYNTNTIVYCRASSNSNPASGNQTRMAFMAYVNSATPTNVEFQYYRSVSSHSDTQQGDQVYVYKLDKTSGWSVTVREAYSKMIPSTGLTKSYSSGALTFSVTNPLPAVTSTDNGKVLRVVSGAWSAVQLPSASGNSF